MSHKVVFKMENGADRNVIISDELEYFRIVENQDRAQSFTNDNYSETANFASYAVLEMGWRFLEEKDFFVDNQLQAFYTQAKRGLPFSFAFDHLKALSGLLTAPFNAGETVVSCDIALDQFEYYWILNQRQKYQVFMCLVNDPFYIVSPASVLNFEIGDPIFSWKYLPELVWIGGGPNESWDETGFYYSFDVRARLVQD